MAVIKLLAAILCVWMISLFVITDGKHKGRTNCGDIFNYTTHAIENNTLVRGSRCAYHVVPFNATDTRIKILLRKLILDKDDNVTISVYNDTTKALFPIFHGQNEGVPLITHANNFTVTIDVSHVEMVRHFEFYYDALAADCMFKVDNDMEVIQETLTDDNSSTTCKFIYNAMSSVYFRHSFTFDLFNLVNKDSSISSKDIQNPITTFQNAEQLQEIFPSKNTTVFTSVIHPGDHYVLRQHHLDPYCSEYVEIETIMNLQSAPVQKLINGSFLDCRWLLHNKNDKALGFKSGVINMTHPYDLVVISDGASFDSPPLYQITSSNAAQISGKVLNTTGAYMVISYKYNSPSSNFAAEVFNADRIHEEPTKCVYIFNDATHAIENNTLVSGTTCAYHIALSNIAEDMKIKILLKKLLLDKDDNVTISVYNDTTKAIFPIFHGQDEGVPLLTSVKNFTVTIDVSPVKMSREFEFRYDANTADCMFKVDNDMEVIQETLTDDNSPSTCEFIYNTTSAHFMHSFTFDLFDLTNKDSFISVKDIENDSITRFQNTEWPQEIFANTNATTFTSVIHPGDHYILRRHLLEPYGKHKGPITCGVVFNETTHAIENNTLVSGTTCSYHIAPLNMTEDVKQIKILLRKLILDKDDDVTISAYKDTTKALFPIFHGQNEAVPLLTQARNFTVTINVSDTKMLRHFELYYDAIAKECTFKVDDDMEVIQETLTDDNSSSTCEFTYDAKAAVYFRHSFTFDLFNLTNNNSSVSVVDVQNIATKFHSTERPQELFAAKNTTKFTSTINPGDHYVLRQHHLNPYCSSFLETETVTNLQSAHVEKLINGSFLDCRWLIHNKNDKALGFEPRVINLTHPYDLVVISDGTTFDSPPLYQITSSNVAQISDQVLMTSEPYMVVSYKYNSPSSNFASAVFNAGQGKLYKDQGTINMAPSSANTTTFLIEVNETRNVVINFGSADIGDGSLDIYDDFHYKGKLIATLTGALWYPVLSTTNRMMIIASQFQKSSFNAEFHGTPSGCTKMNQGKTDNSYILSRTCNETCEWIIPPTALADTDLILDVQFLALDEEDSVTIKRLDKDGTVVATITPNITHFPQIMLNSLEGALLSVKQGSCEKALDKIILVAQSTYVPKCSRNISLSVMNTVQISSPSFPNTYPILAECTNKINTTVKTQLIHVAVNKLQLAPNHYLSVANSSISIKYTGSELPDDAFFKDEMEVVFNSKNGTTQVTVETSAGEQGFALNVTAADCGDVIPFTSSGNITNTPNKTCIWKITANPSKGEKDVAIVIFSVKENKIENYDLQIYDGASVRANKITNRTSDEIWSRTDSLIIVYKLLDSSKPASNITINYKPMVCNTSMQCGNKICLHPNWRCNGINDCGDFTDEKDCDSVPVTPTAAPPAPAPHGVSATLFGIMIIIMFALGVILTLSVPNLYERYRNSRYSQFRDVSVIE